MSRRVESRYSKKHKYLDVTSERSSSPVYGEYSPLFFTSGVELYSHIGINLVILDNLRTNKLFMPVRKIPLITSQIYHVFNRGVEKRKIFKDKRDYRRLIDTLNYYRYSHINLKYSDYLKLNSNEKFRIQNNLVQKISPVIKLQCFTLMPNHFHLLIQQTKDSGISNFMRHISDSYTRYFNIRWDRVGPLFQGQFKAIRIESDEQLLHISRYIHLNPHTGYVVKDFEHLLSYPWSSLNEFITQEHGFCQTSLILKHFSKKLTYRDFLYDQKDYQLELENIKHLLVE